MGMENELPVTTNEQANSQYRPLESFSKKELQDMADKLGLKLPPAMGVAKMAQAIRVKQTRLQLDAQIEASEQRRAETMIEGRKPNFEEILMFGGDFLGKHYEPSPRFIYRFINELDRGDEASFTKGGHLIRCFEKDKGGNPLRVVMPACFCDKPEPPKKGATRAELLEYELLKAVSLVSEGVPVMGMRKDPITGAERSVVIGFSPRYSFIKIEPAPKDAPFGLYLEEPE